MATVQRRRDRDREARMTAVLGLLDAAPRPRRAVRVVRGMVRGAHSLRLLGWRLRKPFAPLVALAALWLLGLGLHGAAVGPVAAALLAGGGAVAAWRLRYRHLDRGCERLYAAVCLLAAVVYLVGTAGGA